MRTIIAYLVAIVFLGCSSGPPAYDATGTFEAVETIISAEASGVIKAFHIEEGETLTKGQIVGYIDSTQLHLRRKQLYAQIRAVLSRKPNVSKQLSALFEQLNHARNEQKRVGNLLKSDAATQKQFDDATSQVAVIERQIEAQESTLAINTTSLTEEALPIKAQIDQLNDQLAKCRIVNEITGTVLVKYAEQFENATIGKPLYKIANLSTITLRAYLTSDQLSAAKINQKVRIFVDGGDGTLKEYSGTISWISDQAEFTPKTIQTKDERANLVYASKIRVKNDELIKIGMYGELKF
ncbi:MAG: HlyD family efflux transporter periplasmic adaptor subunit [Chryseolinea sp.]